MSEEDLKDVAGDAAEQDISEYENLENFVDLEDLSSLMDDDDFTDLEDLGDISDLDLDGDGILEDEAAQAQAEASLTEDDASDSAQAVSLDEPEQEMDYSDMASLDDLPDPSEIEDLGLFSDSGGQPDIPTPEIPVATSERHRWMIWLGIFWMIWMLQEEQPGRKYSRRRRCLILWVQKKMNYQMLLIPQIYKRILKQKRMELRHRLEKQNRMKCRSLFWKKSRKRKPLDLMTFLHWSRRRKMVRRMICRHYWRGCLRMICRSFLRKAARKI